MALTVALAATFAAAPTLIDPAATWAWEGAAAPNSKANATSGNSRDANIIMRPVLIQPGENENQAPRIAVRMLQF